MRTLSHSEISLLKNFGMKMYASKSVQIYNLEDTYPMATYIEWNTLLINLGIFTMILERPFLSETLKLSKIS